MCAAVSAMVSMASLRMDIELYMRDCISGCYFSPYQECKAFCGVPEVLAAHVVDVSVAFGVLVLTFPRNYFFLLLL